MFYGKNFFVLLLFCTTMAVRLTFAREYADIDLPLTKVQANVVREPERFQDHQRVIVKTQPGDYFVRLSLPLQPRVQFGDAIEFLCGREQRGVSKKKYTDSSFFHTPLHASCFYPGVSVVGTHSSFARTLFVFKERMNARFQKSMPAPEGFILTAMLFGNGSSIPRDVWEDFRVTGTTHLLVISGMHIIFLANFLLWCCTFFPIPRRASLILVAGLLLLYVALAGFQSASVRALVFGLIMFCAEWFERRVSAMRLLVYAAMVMLLVQPNLLVHDIGFQLSFAAVAGILVTTRLLGRYRERPNTMRTFIAATFGATLFTMPLVAWHFHTVSLIGLLVNLFAVPIVTIIMAGGVFLTIVATISSSVAVGASLPIFFLLRFLLAIIAWCADLPFASFAW